MAHFLSKVVELEPEKICFGATINGAFQPLRLPVQLYPLWSRQLSER